MDLVCVVRTFLSSDWQRLAKYAGAIGISFAAAVLLAPLILYLYRRRVVRLMNTVAAARDAIAQPLLTAHANAPDGVKLIAGAEVLRHAASERATQLNRSLRIVALVFAVVTVAVALALRWQAVSNGPGAAPEASAVNVIAWSMIAVFWTLLALGLSWPIVVLGTANPRFGRRFMLVTLPCFLLLVSMPLANSQLEGSQLSGYIALLAIVALMCIGLVPRHMRNVVPTLSVSLSLAVIAWMEGNILAGSANKCIAWHSLHSRAEVLGVGVLVLAPVAGVLALGLYGIYRMLRTMASAYRRKRFSDSQLQILFWYMALAVPIAGHIYASQRGPSAPPLVLVIGLSILPTVIAYAVLMRRLSPAHRPPLTLLLLRVFGQTRRGERLLDSLAASWRFIGPVCMIGGPDLAKASLEPHELAALLTRRLKQGFVTSEATLQETLAQLDLLPDPDRRYRINEVYCAGEIWTRAARQLIERCDVVLIDLREFHAGRQGTATELAMLASVGALTKTIAIVGKTTALDAVGAVLEKSASGTGTIDALRTLNIDKIDDAAFFENVLAVAQPSATGTRSSN